MPKDQYRTATLSGTIDEYCRRWLAGAHVMLPAKVLEYDAATQTVKAKPLLTYTPVGGNPEELPDIWEVPVVFPRVSAGVGGPQAHMYFPIKPDTNVMLIFADRSMDQWRKQGGTVDPKDPRSHHLTDAVAFPGLFSQANPIADVDPSDLRIQLKWPERGIDSEIYLGGDTNDIVLRAGNMVRLGSSTADQSAVLGDLFKAFFDLHVHGTGVGPSSPPTVPMTANLLSTKVKAE